MNKLATNGLTKIAGAAQDRIDNIVNSNVDNASGINALARKANLGTSIPASKPVVAKGIKGASVLMGRMKGAGDKGDSPIGSTTHPDGTVTETTRSYNPSLIERKTEEGAQSQAARNLLPEWLQGNGRAKGGSLNKLATISR